MQFVDGENLTLRAQDVAEKRSLTLQAGEYYERDVFVWLPGIDGTRNLSRGLQSHPELRASATRAYCYTSASGDEGKLRDLEERIWKRSFEPRVFKKARGRRAKKVDIMLTRDMLSHAFYDHFDAAVLVSGDQDFVPLVEEVKRLGKLVYVYFFEDSGLSDELRLSADEFAPLTEFFVQRWTSAE